MSAGVGQRHAPAPPAGTAPLRLLVHALFFLSGVPALLYQIAWLRALFMIYGTNIESVTAVVAAFLLGLGVGSLVGGAVSVRWSRHLLPIFAAIELAIAAYGISSMTLFARVGELTAGVGVVAVGLLSFVLIVLPTMLMGATLPILVAFLVRATGRVGVSVGGLYFVNTLGAAVACFLAAFFAMGRLGLSGTVAAAAGLNASIALTALAVWLFGPRTAVSVAIESAAAPPPRAAGGLGLPLAMLLAGVAGFVSLSYEILWVRAYSIAMQGSAFAFPMVLGFFLLGVASGAKIGRDLSAAVERGRGDGRAQLAALMLLASVFGYLVVPAMAHALAVVSVVWTMALVTLGAALWGAMLPLLSQLSLAADHRAGRGLSWLYAANILGTVAGSLITGFVLLDLIALRDVVVLLTLLALAVAVAVLPVRASTPARRWSRVGGLVAVMALLTLAAPTVFDRLYERLHFHQLDLNPPLVAVVENKSGVIAVREDGIVYGGGVYDGAFNLDPLHDANGIFRAYAVSAFHAGPRNVLMIGLSSGSWAQVLAHHPALRRMTVVEINPGYNDLIRHEPMVRSLLDNPKVRIVIDDGRRWLRRYRGPRFDAVVMNTTFHWRAYVSGLLSERFLGLVKAHLKPDGFVYLNATGSDRALKTVATHFADAYRISSFILAGDRPFTIDLDRWQRIVEGYSIDGHPILPAGSADAQRFVDGFRAMVENRDSASDDAFHSIESRASILRRAGTLAVITDDNMGEEWSGR